MRTIYVAPFRNVLQKIQAETLEKNPSLSLSDKCIEFYFMCITQNMGHNFRLNVPSEERSKNGCFLRFV